MGITNYVTGKIRRTNIGLLHLAYRGMSAVNGKYLRGILTAPAEAEYKLSPDQVLRETVFNVGPNLAHVVLKVTGIDPSKEFMNETILQAVKDGLFHNYGEAIFIKLTRVDELLERLMISPEKKEEFLTAAKKYPLFYEDLYSGQANALFPSIPRSLERGNYVQKPYVVATRDGELIHFGLLRHMDNVKPNDDSPNVIMVPALACSSATFDMSEKESPAMDLADSSNWVYLFEERGIGKNSGKFDPNAFIDTFISNDLPAVLSFVFRRSKMTKPAVLIGHSMGGIISKFMVVRYAFKIRKALDHIELILNKKFDIRKKTKAQIAEMLDEIERAAVAHARKDTIAIHLEEAKASLESLKAVKAIITLGSPSIFDKYSHEIFAFVLMLNHLLPMIRVDRVPVKLGKWFVKHVPGVVKLLRVLINPKNFDDPDAFLKEFVEKGTDDFPMGVGLQFLKSIFSGNGIKRMGETFNYTGSLNLIPIDIKIIDIVGSDDILCPDFNLSFIDPKYGEQHPKIAKHPTYSHENRSVIRVSSSDALDDIPLPTGDSYAQGYVIEGVGHLDFLYGKTAEAIIKPLLMKILANLKE